MARQNAISVDYNAMLTRDVDNLHVSFQGPDGKLYVGKMTTRNPRFIEVTVLSVNDVPCEQTFCRLTRTGENTAIFEQF